MSGNYERALLLLSVIEKAAAHGSLYSAIIGDAGAELDEMNKEAQKEVSDRAKAAAESQAKAKAQADAKAKADEEEKSPAPIPSPAPITRRPIVETTNGA